MSHTTTLKTVAIRSVSALHQAVAKLQREGVNCELVENAKPRMYSTQQAPTCEHVLKLKDSQYDVGFLMQEDGSYAPVFDEWGKHIGNQLGADVNVCPMPNSAEGRAQHQIGKFMQAYTEAATIEAAVAQGYIVDSAVQDNEGNVHLTLSGM